ncbi:hypothetical protein [Haliangium ochraceum]|uniref:Uncharacterized protein n=1 Tax=Haliangium ochraceum (strain DSM 14365 / JCM 11303 / SMP-2) TaxID=502025 RepID=D0LU75_HALO1|nr:hypothetical protein [Haliangium ochraceum]ACY17439.1 hypothetical protein Hoch_4950 [Haliangium ochraceum DSM 14365]
MRNRYLKSLRLFAIAALALLLLPLGGCETKLKEEDCRRAIANVRTLYGTANMQQGIQPEAAVRSCRGSASAETVECMANAKTMEELDNCKGDEFLEAMRGDAPQDNQPEADEGAASADE